MLYGAESRTTLLTSTASRHVSSARAQYMYKFTTPTARPESPPTCGKDCSPPEQDRTAFSLQFALAHPTGKERFPRSVGSKVAGEFGVEDSYPRKLWTCVRDSWILDIPFLRDQHDNLAGRRISCGRDSWQCGKSTHRIAR